MTETYRWKTVIDALLDAARRTPDRMAFRVIERSTDEFVLSYGDVYRLVRHTVAGITAHGIDELDRVVIILPTSCDFLSVYLGCLYSGVVPIVVAEPMDGRIEHYATNLRGLVERAQARRVIVSAELAGALAPLLPIPVLTPDALRDAPLRLGPPRAAPASVAHLQATSGSTGAPKLAVVRHGNVVANVHGIAQAIRGRSDDLLVSWLPLFHDMGLIGISYALYAQIPMVLADPVNFLRNPLSWLHWISRYRGTLSPAPSSAFHMCVRVAKQRPPDDLDLTSWRVALCGAEPVHETTMREFQATFGRHGLPETTLRPVYGLAEATLAVTISDVTRPYSVDRVDAEAVAVRGHAEPRSTADPRTSDVMCVGLVLPGHGLRVVDASGVRLPDRAIGEIEVCGPSVVDGYLAEPGDSNADSNADAVDDRLRRADGYLRTGDLGYRVDGELYVTGRRKDIVIIAGRNYIPDLLETFVESLVEGSRTPAVVAVGVPDPVLRTEQLHLLLDERLAADRDRRTIAGQVRDALAEVFGIGGVTVHWVRRAELPRTTSGKIQRHLCRRMIEERLTAHHPGTTPADAPDRTSDDDVGHVVGQPR